MDEDGSERRRKYIDEDGQGATSTGAVLSAHSSHEFNMDESHTTVVAYGGKLDGVIFATQVSAKKAREAFGDSGAAAIEEETSSLLKKKALSAALKSSSSESQRKKAIRASCFVRMAWHVA